MPLDVGILFSFRNPPFNRRPWTEVYDAGLALAGDAERLGYGHVWLSEHHFVDDGYSPSLMTIAGAIAARTSRIRIGTYVVLLPLHDAVTLAEDAATVDILSHGRLDLGLAQGYVPSEFDPRGIPHRERAGRMDEGLQVVRGLLRRETVSFDGRYNQLDGVRISPPPVQDPLPIWVGARGPKALDRAARMGFHLASSTPESGALYAEALLRHGRDPADFDVVQLVTVYCAETRAQAWHDIAEPYHHTLSNYLEWATASGDIGEEQLAAVRVPTPDDFRTRQQGDFFGAPIHVGTPAEVLAGLREHLRAAPSTHLVMQMALAGNDPANTRRSMELFAEHVLPHLPDTTTTKQER